MSNQSDREQPHTEEESHEAVQQDSQVSSNYFSGENVVASGVSGEDVHISGENVTASEVSGEIVHISGKNVTASGVSGENVHVSGENVYFSGENVVVYQHFYPDNMPLDEKTTIRIRITEEPLTTQNLMTIVSVLTELHTKCWLIQQNRLADLMDYAQTRDIRFNKEANLRIAQMAHNSPALIEFLVSSASIAGTATLALALKTAIDAVVQAPLRFRTTQLQNQKEALEQKIHEQEAQQAQQITAQKAQVELERQTMLLDLTKKQIEVEKQQLDLDKQRLELEKNRVKVVLEIAKTMVSQLQSDANEETREMLVQSLVPSLLQLATTDGLELALPAPQKSENQESQTESK